MMMTACRESEYERVLERELASNVRQDSLFLGIKLGMTSKEFYTHCWKINKQGLIRQGNSNTSVLYEMPNQLKFPAEMNFYPTFYEDRIYEMPVTFSYVNWAPWNKPTRADSLQVEVLDLMQKWYGEDFIEIPGENGKVAYVRIDGNRRISVSVLNERQVSVLFTDMLLNEEVEAEIQKRRERQQQ